MGNADFFRKKANGLILQAGPPTRHKLIVDVIKEFPPTLSSADAYNRLQQVFAKEGMPFDRKSYAAMMAAQRARKQVGFEIKYTPVPTWVRMLGGDTVLPNLLPTTTHD